MTRVADPECRSRDQTTLWEGLNATTGEHVDLSDLALVGAQLDLVMAVQAVAKKTVVVFISGKPVAEPWIQDNVDAVCTKLSFFGESFTDRHLQVVQQFYPGELVCVPSSPVVVIDVDGPGRHRDSRSAVRSFQPFR